MSVSKPVEYRDAPPEVRAVFDDIKKTRQVEDVNNFWKYLANDPVTLRRTWESIKEVMAPGALDVRTKEMIYLAISVSNGCEYCTASHGPVSRYDLTRVSAPTSSALPTANPMRHPVIEKLFESKKNSIATSRAPAISKMLGAR